MGSKKRRSGEENEWIRGLEMRVKEMNVDQAAIFETRERERELLFLFLHILSLSLSLEWESSLH